MANSSKITTVSEGLLDTELVTWNTATKTLGEVGSDGTAATDADTALGTALAGSNKAFTSVSETGGVMSYKYTLSFSEQNGETVQEIGIFDASDNLHARVAFPDDVITKANTAEYTFTLAETNTTTINP